MSREEFLDELKLVTAASDAPELNPDGLELDDPGAAKTDRAAESDSAGTERKHAESGKTDAPGADSADATEPQSEVESEKQTRRSPRDLRRRRKQQNAIAGVLAAVLIISVLATTFFSTDPAAKEVVAIRSNMVVENLIAEAKTAKLSKLHLSDYVVDDSMIADLGEVHSLDTLIVDKGALTDASMNIIAELPVLNHLRLRLSPIADEGLEQLSNIESLWYLNLPHAECTAEGVGALAKLKNLRQLRLGSPYLGNEVTREIARITSLRGIHLIGVAVTDEGLKTLAAMPYLESLYLDDSAVTEAGWDWLFRVHPDLHVHIDQAHHDRDPRAHKHH